MKRSFITREECGERKKKQNGSLRALEGEKWKWTKREKNSNYEISSLFIRDSDEKELVFCRQ